MKKTKDQLRAMPIVTVEEIISFRGEVFFHIAELNEKMDEYIIALHEVVNVFAGMEGVEAETAPEKYLMKIINDMYEAARLPLYQPIRIKNE